MISGDHVINVAISAQECKIIGEKEKILIVEKLEDNKLTYCDLANTEEQFETTIKDFLAIPNKAICFTNSNSALSELLTNKNSEYSELIAKTVVFARTTPV